MNFWSNKLFSTLICYTILGLCVKQVSDVWPRAQDGRFAGLGHPSESVDRFSGQAKVRALKAIDTVKSKGILALIKEAMSEVRTGASRQMESVREIGLTKDGLKTSFTQLKEKSKSLADTNGTYDTLKQLATEAKATVSDQVHVDAEVNVDRPLVANGGGSSGESDPLKIPKSSDAVRSVASDDKPARKKAQMEVYVPRKRSGTTDEPSQSKQARVIARQNDSPPKRSGSGNRGRSVPR